MSARIYRTQVAIIGAGVTGIGLARDLALRGVDCIVLERGDINSGASGANHGLLHSGGRYAANDATAAIECREEGEILKKLAPHCIEETGGLFVAVEGDDENFAADFPQHCRRCGISLQELDPKDAKEYEPALSDRVIAAYSVPDASIDPFQLSLDNMAQAFSLGGVLLTNTCVTGFRISDGRITSIAVKNGRTGEEALIESDQVVNASGAWAGEVAALAGISMTVRCSKGSLVITDCRLTDRVINRLRPSSDADILVPGGTVSIIGTTSIRLDNPNDISPSVEEVDYIIDSASAIIPALKTTRFIRAYAGVRPLVSAGTQADDDRGVSRGFALLDHSVDGLDNFTTISGGKLTTFRLMAEKTADLVCGKLGVTRPCLTAVESLPPTFQWTRPGFAPQSWMERQEQGDFLLCECEMTPRSALDEIIREISRQGGEAGLRAIGLRSRIGKGICQGVFCGVRISAHMYDRSYFTGDKGLMDLQSFLAGRWKGIRPVLWGDSLIQEELQEAMHCGLFSLELHAGPAHDWLV